MLLYNRRLFSLRRRRGVAADHGADWFCARRRVVATLFFFFSTDTNLHGKNTDQSDNLNQEQIIPLTHSLCDSNRFSEAHHLLLSRIPSDFIPDERTCNVLIARLLDSRHPQNTMRVVRRLIAVKPGFVPSLLNYHRLIDQFCADGRVRDGHGLFFDARMRGHCLNVVSYTSLVNGYCKHGQMGLAWKVFDEMRDSGVSPNSFTYSVLIRGVLRTRDVARARELMNDLWVEMGEDQSSVNNAAFANLIDSLCCEGFVQDVFKIAEKMPRQGGSVEPNFAYAQMIDSLCRSGRSNGASRIVYLMRKSGYNPSLVSYNYIVHRLCKEGCCMRAYQLLDEGLEFGYVPSEYTFKVLVDCLCEEHDLIKAKKVLELMLSNAAGVSRTRLYNIYLRSVCRMKNPTELLNVLVSMLETDCHPDVITLNTVINGFCEMGRVEDASKVLNDMITGRFCHPDAVTFTTIIGGLLNIGREDEALETLHRVMPQHGFTPNVVTYNLVIHGLLKNKNINEALEVFYSMIGKNAAADSNTYAIIIDGLFEFNRIDEAKSLWDDVIWPSKIHDSYVYAAFIKGLCRSDKFEEACDFLYELVDCGAKPNIVNYNILIDKACKLGLKKQAYQIVGEMRKNGLELDAVTWRTLDKLGKYETDETNHATSAVL